MRDSRGVCSKRSIITIFFALFFSFACLAGQPALLAEAATPTELTLDLVHRYGTGGTVTDDKTITLGQDGTTTVDLVDWAVYSHGGKDYELDAIDVQTLAQYEVRYYKDDVTPASNYLGSDLGHLAPNNALPPSALKGASDFSGIVGFNPAEYEETGVTSGDSATIVAEDPTLNVVSIVFYKPTPTTTTYTVEHYDIHTGAEIRSADTKEGTVGSSVNAVDVSADIYNYVYRHGDPDPLLLGSDAAQNVIKLYYQIKTVSYVVHYVESSDQGGVSARAAGDPILPPKYASADVGDTITPDDEVILIDSYTYHSAHPDEGFTVSVDEAHNVLTLYYTLTPTTTYTVNYWCYYEMPTQQRSFSFDIEPGWALEMMISRDVTGEVGQQINAEDERLDEYMFDNHYSFFWQADPENLILVEDAAQNVIDLYYRADRFQTAYKVHYLNANTENRIAPTDIFSTDKTGGEALAVTQSMVLNIEGYTFRYADPEIGDTITLNWDPQQNNIYLYYESNAPIAVSYDFQLWLAERWGPYGPEDYSKYGLLSAMPGYEGEYTFTGEVGDYIEIHQWGLFDIADLIYEALGETVGVEVDWDRHSDPASLKRLTADAAKNIWDLYFYKYEYAQQEASLAANQSLFASTVSLLAVDEYGKKLYGNNLYTVTYTYSPKAQPEPGCEGDCGGGCSALPIAGALGFLAIPIAWFAVKRKK